jgi:hypothetical protein
MVPANELLLLRSLGKDDETYKDEESRMTADVDRF